MGKAHQQRRPCTLGIVLAGSLLNGTFTTYAVDMVTLSNGECGENGVIVDGIDEADGTTFRNDELPPAKPANQNIPLTRNLTGSGEVIAFTNNRPPTMSPAYWSTGSYDNASVSFEPKYKIPVAAWIIKGPYGSQKTRAGLLREETNTLWFQERQGIELDSASFVVNDATDSSNSWFIDFTCAKADQLTPAIHSSGQVNIYFVDTVSGVDTGNVPVTTSGIYCYNKDVVAVGYDANSQNLLAHELGHAFRLDHVGGLPTFDKINVMHESSNARAFLTEGQTFRANLQAFSVINSLYNKRTGLPTTFDCSQQTKQSDYKDLAHERRCPLLQTRVWPDTTYAPTPCNTPPAAPSNLRVQ